MKKMLKVLAVVAIVLVVAFTMTSVFAIDVPTDAELVGDATGSTAVTGAANRVWKTVITIIQILAVAAVVFAGLRYMFASAEDKADIKKSMMILVIGAVLVFAATTILGFIQTAANEIVVSPVVTP